MLIENPNYELLPPTIAAGMRRYIEDHIETGTFLRFVLEGNLYQAVTYADPENRKALTDIVLWLKAYAPELCYGSPACVQAWLEAQK